MSMNMERGTWDELYLGVNLIRAGDGIDMNSERSRGSTLGF